MRILITSMRLVALCSAFALTAACDSPIHDEARRAGRLAASMPAADEDYFKQMDGGIELTASEVRGRNNWNVWTGGNDRFWDAISVRSGGTLDFLKTLSSHGALKFSRDNRWGYLGLVNEPCFQKATGPDRQRFGLWLDKRIVSPECPPDPFENAQKYPGIVIGSRGKELPNGAGWDNKTMPVGSYYGYATGVLGLRLFPNPDFDEAAARKWDPERYYSDPSYYDSKTLIKPYRVGMSCGFCHIGPDPLRPPADPEKPAFANLSSYVGAQYFWVDRIFAWRSDESSFMFQLFHTSRPGALDTSLVSTDNVNNPRTMNAVYNLQARLEIAKALAEEKLGGGGLDSKQLNDFVKSGPLTQYFEPPDKVWTPHVLKDGADSVGALGALNRVYVNIGLFSEEWMTHFNPLVGGKRVSPMPIKLSRQNSEYWQATEAQTPDLALFFLKAAVPHKLMHAHGGEPYLKSATPADVERGKTVFADTCARCHSSKLPQQASSFLAGCIGASYLDCFNKYFAWTKTEEFKSQMRAIVAAPNFLDNNFLSTDMRVPVTLLQTNACSPLAANGIRDNIWDNFTSESYKSLPSVGKITWYHPYDGTAHAFDAPAGGRGYTRPASLVSLWSTAPFLLNNALGDLDPGGAGGTFAYTPPPSVEARMRAFDDGIEKLLWPEKRDRDPIIGDKLTLTLASGEKLPLPSLIDRTTKTSYIRLPAGYVPGGMRTLVGRGREWFPWLFNDTGDIEIGPIPAGTPVNLLANLQVLSESAGLSDRAGHTADVLKLVKKVKDDLKSLPAGATDEQARAQFKDLVWPLLNMSTCPDMIVNRGHYFGTKYQFGERPLSDADKRALIEFLKTF